MAEPNKRVNYVNAHGNTNFHQRKPIQTYNSEIPYYNSQRQTNLNFIMNNRNTNSGISPRQTSIKSNIPIVHQSNNTAFRPESISAQGVRQTGATYSRPQSIPVYQYQSQIERNSKPNYMISHQLPIINTRPNSNQTRIGQYQQPVIKEVKAYLPPQVRLTKIIKSDPKVEVYDQNIWNQYYSNTRKTNPPPAAPQKTSEKSICSPIILCIIGFIALLGLIGTIILAVSLNSNNEPNSFKKYTSVNGIPMKSQYSIIQQQIVVDISKRNSSSKDTTDSPASSSSSPKTDKITSVAPKFKPITEVQPIKNAPITPSDNIGIQYPPNYQPSNDHKFSSSKKNLHKLHPSQ